MINKCEDAVARMMEINGVKVAAIMNYENGMVLAGKGGNLDTIAAGRSGLVSSHFDSMKMLGLDNELKDIVVTSDSQYYIIRPLSSKFHGLYLYCQGELNNSDPIVARDVLKEIQNEIFN